MTTPPMTELDACKRAEEIVRHHYDNSLDLRPCIARGLLAESRIDTLTVENATLRAKHATLVASLHDLPQVAGVPQQEVYLNFDDKGLPECFMHSGERRCAITMPMAWGLSTPHGLEWLQSLCKNISLFLNARRVAATDTTNARNLP